MKTTIIIIAYIITLIGGIAGLSYHYSATEKTNTENFVGIDAAGFKHYPNGDVKLMKSNY